MSERQEWFTVAGVRCAARLALPAAPRPPVIVMAHGFGAERTFGLQPFIDAFVAAGAAVFSFDYRCFGASEGAPRNYIDPGRHLEDWRAALAHARTLADVDTSRIGLWGTSFSGGHALVTAARDRGVAGVVAQVPFVDGVATAAHLRLRDIVAGLAHGVADLARAALGGPPHTVPVVGTPAAFALLNTPDAMEGYRKLADPRSAWQNAAPARVALQVPLYRPVREYRRVNCPVLMLYAENDSLIPAKAVRRAAARLRNVELHAFPIGHFDLYTGAWFEKAIALERDFFRRCLGLATVAS